MVLFLCLLISLHFRRILKQSVHIKQAYDIIILSVQIGFDQFQNMIDVAVLREIRRDLEGVAARGPQRVKIEPLYPLRL